MSERAEQVLDAHLHYLRGLTERGGGTAADLGGVMVAANVHPLPFLLNVAARTAADVEPDDVIDRVTAFFVEAGRPGFEIVALVGRDDDLVEAARRRGMQVGEHPEPLQARDALLDPNFAPAPTGVELRWAREERDVEAVIAITRDAHRVYGFPDDVWPTIFGRPETVLAGDLDVLIASRDGRDIGTAQLGHGMVPAYIGWVAVDPGAGRTGVGRYLMRVLVDRAFERGASDIGLLASPMGAPLYRALGFDDVGQIRSISPAPG